MSHDFEQVFYHVLVVVLPILVYHLFLVEKSEQNKLIDRRLLFILLGMLLLTMVYPVVFAKGYTYDFRVIPILVGFLYGGRVTGAIILVTMLTYRYAMGGTGFYVTLLNYSVATAVLIFITPKYKFFTMRIKIVVISAIYWGIAFTRFLTLIKIGQIEQLTFMGIFSVITWLTLITIIFLVENLNQQMALRKELQRTEKLNVISQLAASVAHEVRNPMTSTRGFLQLMLTDHNLTASQKSYINISINELDHAQSIINDYLSLAKPNSKEMGIIHYSEEIKHTIELMKSYTNIQNIFIKSFIEDSLYIKGNKDEIKQVLVNIIKNGIEAMETGGQITVYAFNRDGYVITEIIDSGIGMTKKQLQKVGTPYYSTKDKGTGVGLTICFQIIELLKGKILIESEVGQGTKFTIRIPETKLT